MVAETMEFESDPTEEESSDGNLNAIVGLSIILILIAGSIGFEMVKSQIERAASKKYEPVIDKLFGEMTVLGFLSLMTFCVMQAGVFGQISEKVFGNDEELEEKFEAIHFGLFFVMIIYVLKVTAIVKQAKIIEGEWSRICQLCHEPTSAEQCARDAALRPKSSLEIMYDFFLPDIGGKEALLLYYGLRKEFVLERQIDYPFLPKDRKERVDPSFNFSMYLARCLQRTLEHLVEIELPTYVFFAVFSMLFFVYSNFVENNTTVLSWTWVGLRWFALLFCCFFHHHLATVRKAMGWQISMDGSNEIDSESTSLVAGQSFDCTHLPPWTRIELDEEAKRKNQNRQQMLFWGREHGPELYLIILQINLVFSCVYWAMNILVYVPHMATHEPPPVFVLFLVLSALPLCLWQKITRNLVASITQVSSVGYLRKHDIIGYVIRDMKIEAMIRAFLVLHKIIHSAEDIAKNQDGKNQPSDRSLRRDSSIRLDSSLATTASLSVQARREVERSFEAMDKDGDGFLEHDEITLLLQSLGMCCTDEMSKKIIGVLDTDGDGIISKDEFVSFYEDCLLDEEGSTPEAKAHILFSIFDSDGNGEITATEFKETLSAFHLGFSLEDIGDLLRELDEDSSGTICIHEFEELVEKYFPKENASKPQISPSPSFLTSRHRGTSWNEMSFYVREE